MAVTASLAVLAMRKAPGVEASTEVHGTPGEVTIINFSNDGKNLGKQTVAKVVKTDGEWRQQLGANSFEISRQADTEMPYSGVSLNEHSQGVFRCICCDTALFNSQVVEITRDAVLAETPEGRQTLKNDFVFALIGYHPDTSTFENSNGQPKFHKVEVKMKADDAYLLHGQVDSTPTIVVNGKYRLTTETAGGADQVVQLVKFLVNKESH